MKETVFKLVLSAVYYLIVTPLGLCRQVCGSVGSRAWLRGRRSRGGWQEFHLDSHDKSIYQKDA